MIRPRFHRIGSDSSLVALNGAWAGGSDGTVVSQSTRVDSDCDGVFDGDDACPDSDLSATVVIRGSDTGVPNVVLANGCSIMDEVGHCAEGAKNHGAFVSCVAQLTNSLVEQGILTDAQKDAIQRATAKK